MTDEPIVPQDYVSGPKVVDIGDLRVSRGMTRRTHSACPHKDLRYDTTERRIWCGDCERDIDPFDAFAGIVAGIHYERRTLERERAQVAEATQFQCRTVAARNMDEAWRRKATVPTCPHCRNGLFPEDFRTRVDEMRRQDAIDKLGRTDIRS